MRFEWTSETLRFRRDAAEYTGLDRQLAARILPHMTPGARVCDAGCGLGYLSLALAEAGMAVTAVDTAPAPLAVLRENAARRGLARLEVLERSAYALRPEPPYDAMVFCIFGETLPLLRAARTACRGELFLIRKDCSAHRFAVTPRPFDQPNADTVCAALDDAGVPYQAERFRLDMGQPLRSLADARQFFRLFGGGEIDDTALWERLRPTGRADFPYYLPAESGLALLRIQSSAIPMTI